MNTQYNLDFLISALALLLLIFAHFISDRRIDTHKNKIFLIYMTVGILNIVTDIVTSVLIMMQSVGPAVLTEWLLTMFYILQIAAPSCFVFYAQSMRDTTREVLQRFMCFFAVPMIVILMIIITNTFTNILFTVESDGRYFHGPYYNLMYVYVAFCAFIIIVSMIINRREYEKRQIVIIIECLCVMVVCVTAQVLLPAISLTGVAIALIIMILLITLHNPYSYTDNLTGLYDMQFFREYLRYIKAYSRRYHIISCCITNTNYISSIMGVDKGTDLIKKTAAGLRSISPSDYVFRLDRSRFVVLTHTLREYDIVMTELSKHMRNHKNPAANTVGTEAVICGIIDAQRLVSSANVLAYTEYLESLAPKTETAVIIQSDNKTMQGFNYNQEVTRYLKYAIENDLFDVYFQPVYSIKDKCFISMEALSRLSHPAYGSIPPDIFIQLAERNGDIARIGQLQLRRICRFVKEHSEEFKGIKNIKVNLSPAEFMGNDVSKSLRKVINEYGVDPSLFQFEITETVATQYSESLSQLLSDFRNEGIGLCMDDFGSGYANLNTVMKLPFTTIKLDRTLLAGIGTSEKVSLFYRSIASVLSDMGYYVVAEGVETEDEIQFVRGCKVDFVQGYYFSKPLSRSDLLKLLKDNEPGKVYVAGKEATENGKL